MYNDEFRIVSAHVLTSRLNEASRIREANVKHLNSASNFHLLNVAHVSPVSAATEDLAQGLPDLSCPDNQVGQVASMNALALAKMGGYSAGIISKLPNIFCLVSSETRG